MIKKLTLLAAGLFAGIFTTGLSAQSPCFQLTCPPAVQNICDLSDNDPVLWNHIDWWDPATQSNNLADAEVDLSLLVEDNCANSLQVSFDLQLDLDGDGLFDTQISSAALADIPAGYVPYNNFPDPGKLEYRVFDLRNVAPEANYRFALQTTSSGTTRTYRIAWNTEQAPDNFLPLQLPYGQHRVVWRVSDGLGTVKLCDSYFQLADCKKPTVVCLNGLSANIMTSGLITLWATDFLQHATDNYTPSNSLQLGLRKSGNGTGFPLNPDGTPANRIVFDCDEKGTHTVELWAHDAAGNTDYCETSILVKDDGGFCNIIGPGDTIQLCLSYCADQFPLPVNYILTGSHPSLPPTIFYPTFPIDSFGCKKFTLSGVPFLDNYVLTPTKDDDPLNGLSTYDLVLIQRHILGLEPLNTPFKMIAADANNSRSVSTFDIQELRQLILGIYTELPNNTSWRFIPKDYMFPDPQNPFSTIFPETVQFYDVTDTTRFNGVKIGDVNCSATPSGQLPQRELLNRGKTFCLNLGGKSYSAGASFTLPVRAGQSGSLLGYQFQLKAAQVLQVEGVIPGPGQTLDNFGLFTQRNELSCSWSNATAADVQAGDTLFFIKFRANSWTTLENALSFKQNRIYAEAYNDQGEYQPLSLCFADTKLPPGNPGSELQMIVQPNPVADRSWLITPAATKGALHWELRDFSGRVLLQGTETVQDGQSVEMSLETLAAGIYLYRVQVGDVVQTGKLVKL